MDRVYIIGEIGQNHNGSVDIAKLLVDLVARPIKEDLFNLDLQPMNAIKLTKRDLDEEFSQKQMNTIYDNPNSFGTTYGEHRKFLELTNEQHLEIAMHALKKGLDVVETICSRGAMRVLNYFIPTYVKVASRDLTNLPLLEELSETMIPIILSTGMGGKKELEEALNIITKKHSNIAILHCVSEYPTQPRNVNLNTISYLKKQYPDFIIGYSDHTIGISASIAAVALGAKLIEKHITIDRSMKGTDQAGSLGPDGVNRMIRDIRITELSMGSDNLFISEGSISAKLKLERSIATKRYLMRGDIIQLNDIHLLSPGDGFKWNEKEKVIGKVLKQDIGVNEIIYPEILL